MHKKDEKSGFFKVLELVNTFLVVISLCISAYAIFSSNNLLQYQLEQERLPRVVCLNQNMTTTLKRDNYGNISTFDSIDNMMLKVYNVGVGIAQNCEMRWDIESVKNACIKIKELLKYPIRIHEFEYDDIANQSLYLYDYSFQLKEDELDALWYYDNELSDYMISDFEIAPTQKPYILPITTEKDDSYIKVPDILAVLLLALGNQEITDPISLQLNLYYQDMSGKEYNETFIVTFAFDRITAKNEVFDCAYSIDTKKQ